MPRRSRASCSYHRPHSASRPSRCGIPPTRSAPSRSRAPSSGIELFDRWAIPSPGKPLFEAAFAGFAPHSPAKVDTRNNTRGPLLLITGTADHTVPTIITKQTRRLYRKSSAVTDYKEFAGRGHSLCLDRGWGDVTDASLAWLSKTA